MCQKNFVIRLLYTRVINGLEKHSNFIFAIFGERNIYIR